MLYSEFVEATGCRETEKNYNVYKELEIIYMNTDCTKEHIYEMGMKLVDNSKTEKELELERQIKEEIEAYKEDIERYKSDLYFTEADLRYWQAEGDKTMVSLKKNSVKYYKGEIKALRNKINALKWVLA